jgi:hypothetical protein
MKNVPDSIKSSLFFATLLVDQENPMCKTSRLLAWLNLSNVPCESAGSFNLQNLDLTIAYFMMFFMAMLSQFTFVYMILSATGHMQRTSKVCSMKQITSDVIFISIFQPSIHSVLNTYT